MTNQWPRFAAAASALLVREPADVTLAQLALCAARYADLLDAEYEKRLKAWDEQPYEVRHATAVVGG
jgi:hypothetical protein